MILWGLLSVATHYELNPVTSTPPKSLLYLSISNHFHVSISSRASFVPLRLSSPLSSSSALLSQPFTLSFAPDSAALSRAKRKLYPTLPESPIDQMLDMQNAWSTPMIVSNHVCHMDGNVLAASPIEWFVMKCLSSLVGVCVCTHFRRTLGVLTEGDWIDGTGTQNWNCRVALSETGVQKRRVVQAARSGMF